MKDMIRVLIVDDHPIVRMGISGIVNSQSDMFVAGQAANGQETIRLFEQLRPDVTLLDLRLPDIGGVQVIRKIRLYYPGAKFLVLTTYDGDEDIFQALQAGAVGYLVKGMSHEVLLNGLRQVYEGGQYVPSEITQRLNQRNPQSELSGREHQVLALMAQGSSNKAIAHALGIKEATVKQHVGVILARLNVEDRTQAVLMALRRGLVHL
ncbi:MAG: response regulator transcription factor [Terracidiphilus sp.]|jgi:DNA-binding NarL/FixJ family response regulator